MDFLSLVVFLVKMWANWPSWCCLLVLATLAACQDDEYNILHRDGSFQFGYNNPDSYHHAAGDRNNVVRGEFGGRNPGTGRLDSTQYTAGPRGYRPRGKNVHRKFDLSQNGPRPVGSRDDPYYDPYEDPSYSFEVKTRTYNKQESANRLGDVTGRYNYIDDVGELHNVEYIAGKNTGFHVKTPYPDSNPRAYYGRLYYRGRGKPIPRGRTSIQRGLDGSYRFISAGPDQRRTETSDSSGHVRGSYTYLDDKGVQHSVHYIAGPETGYRVLKNVKGPHLPTLYPFGRPEIIPPDFYDYIKDDFDTAASGHVNPKPIGGSRPSSGGSRPSPGGSRPGSGSAGSKPATDLGEEPDSGSDFGDDLGLESDNLPAAGGGGSGGGGDDFNKPGDDGEKPSSGGGGGGGGFGFKPSPRPPPSSSFGGDDFGDDGDSDDFDGELFGPGSRPSRPKPSPPASRPGGASKPPSRPSGSRPSPQGPSRPSKPDDGDVDDGSYIPPGDPNQDDGSYRPGSNESGLGPEPPRPGGFPSKPPKPSGSDSDDYDDNGLFGSESNARPPPYRPPVIQVQGGSGGSDCESCAATIVTNLGDRIFSVPPGLSVRAHVQSIDLLPLTRKVPSPSEQYKEEMDLKTEQLNSAASDLVTNTTATESTIEKESTTQATTTIETTTLE